MEVISNRMVISMVLIRLEMGKNEGILFFFLTNTALHVMKVYVWVLLYQTNKCLTNPINGNHYIASLVCLVMLNE